MIEFRILCLLSLALSEGSTSPGCEAEFHRVDDECVTQIMPPRKRAQRKGLKVDAEGACPQGMEGSRWPRTPALSFLLPDSCRVQQ